MYTGLNHLHSSLRYLIIIFLIIAIVRALLKWSKNEEFTKLDNTFSLIPFAMTHLQLVIGLVLYFMSPYFQQLLSGSMGEVMKNSIARFYVVEHLLGMLIGIALITIGRIASKKAANSSDKHRKLFVYYGIGLLIILLSIPWPFRGFGNGWF
jgi:predicted membrane channel-forming protein YqfA (hemolysin III family)